MAGGQRSRSPPSGADVTGQTGLMGRVTDRRSVLRVDLAPQPATARRAPDSLAAEEPLELRVGPTGAPRTPLTVTMRTPGNDLDLALGFLLTEGVIRDADDVYTA